MRPTRLFNHQPGNFGFTLIETLVGVAVIAVIGTVIAALLNRTFQSNAKTITVSNIKQNGQYVITQIEQMVRAADAFVCLGNNNSTLTLLKSGTYQRVTFYPPALNTNGYVAVDTPVPRDDLLGSIPDCNLNPTIPYRRCPAHFCAAGFTPVNQVVLTDQNTTSGVSVQSPTVPYITEKSNPGSQDSLIINFDLSPAINYGNSFDKTVGTNNKVNFTTTIDLR